MTTTTTMQVAKERQLDWLLEEVLGARRGAAVRTPPRAIPWLAAAVALFAVGAALGVAWLRAADERSMAQEPDQTIPWHGCHGAGGIDEVPADVSALRCFDFDDAACARLAAKASALPRLTHLDLSGMDVDARGVSRSLPITDAGVRALAPFTGLRWLSLEQCHQMKGEGLQVLEAMPRLEHLDLTYSGVTSPALERLDRLPSLRTLVLSHCMDFHGRSLAAVARLPGLRRLELQACTTARPLPRTRGRLAHDACELRHGSTCATARVASAGRPQAASRPVAKSRRRRPCRTASASPTPSSQPSRRCRSRRCCSAAASR
jgi:hypothetical protein